MAIAITGQYVFRGKANKGSVPVGIIYPDTTRGKLFAPAPGESFSYQELIEISEFVKNIVFSHLRAIPKKPPLRAVPVRRKKTGNKSRRAR
jgi:hypothetical protein